MASIEGGIKNKISHRAIASEKLLALYKKSF
jgi:inosine/xanthosine triphosphate pyrophosphatase family protein